MGTFSDNQVEDEPLDVAYEDKPQGDQEWGVVDIA